MTFLGGATRIVQAPRYVLSALSLLGLFVALAGQDHCPENQLKEYAAEVPKTILQLQQCRSSTSIPIRSNDGRQGSATLVNLAPDINAWYVLQVSWRDRTSTTSYHLENANPRTETLTLDVRYPSGIVIENGKDRSVCSLFGTGVLDGARASPLAFYPLCENQIYLRNTTTGHRTALEATTDLLR